MVVRSEEKCFLKTKPGTSYLRLILYHHHRKPLKCMTLTITNVSKRYSGNVFGLRDFSVTIQSGVLGLLGPNGAGKSTLMRILATITKPTQGTITWNGIDIL